MGVDELSTTRKTRFYNELAEMFLEDILCGLDVCEVGKGSKGKGRQSVSIAFWFRCKGMKKGRFVMAVEKGHD